MRIQNLHIIVSLFIIGAMSPVVGQTNESDGQLNLEFDVVWNGHSWETSIVQDLNVGREGWIAYTILRSDSIPPQLVAKSDLSTREVNWAKVCGLQINVILQKSKKSPEDPANLSDFEMLKGCPISGLNKLVIDYSKYGARFNVDLEKCPWYDFTNQQKTLERFELLGNHAPDFELNSLSGQPLITLKLSKTFGEEISHFPTLMQLEMPGIRQAFAHHAYVLPNLKVIRDIEGAYFNRFHYEHAERYFWLRASEALHRPLYNHDTLKRGMHSNPLNALTESVKKSLPERWVRKGEIYVNEDELPAKTHYKGRGDTLLHGFLKKGKPKGVWTLRIEEQYDYNDFESFHLDLNSKPIEMPENGAWQLNYVDGSPAIIGNLEHRKKTGAWKFFSEAGILVCTRWYRSDTLKRTVVNFHMHGAPLQSRAYYISENASIQSFHSEDRVGFIYIDRLTAEPDAMVINSNSIALQNPDGTYTTYNRNHPNFEMIFRNEVIDKVYPEYAGRPFPYEY